MMKAGFSKVMTAAMAVGLAFGATADARRTMTVDEYGRRIYVQRPEAVGADSAYAPDVVAPTDALQGSGYTPFMLSFVAPVQVPPRDFDVGGLRLSIIYGECVNFDGLDIGLVGRALGHGNGLQANAVNIVDGDGVGIQVNWLAGYVGGEYAGFQVGLVNYATEAQALQIGFYNGAEFAQGLQIGVINMAREMVGVQIGLVNVIQGNDVPFLPILNCSF